MKLLRKDKKESIEGGRYKDLAPEKSIENGEEYFRELNWALNNPRVSNVALTGPYGAGKSSIAESFFARSKEFKPLFISMATFNGGKCDTEELSRGFLQQLFYKVDYKKIPQSRFRKLHRIRARFVWLKLILILLMVLFTICIVDNATFSKILEIITSWGISYGINTFFCSVLSGVVFLSLLGLLSIVIKWIWTHVGNVEISIANKAKFTADKANQESIFNKYLDEIVYFFEATDYDVVVLEDIDRFDNTEIFIRLRELNRLLNSYESIRQHVVFVYALKDDFFESSTERTKFFDFIVSVIPFINSTNSDNLIRRRIEEIEKSGLKIEVEDDYITQVSPYISDMRVLTSIFNDFVLYKNTLNKDIELKLSDEQLLSLMIYKNLNPQDFAEIESERGMIKDAFKAKKDFVDAETIELQNKLNKLSGSIDIASKDALLSIEEFKASLLYKLSRKTGTVNSIQADGKTIKFAELMSDGFDLARICNRPLQIYTVNSINGGNSFSVKDISEIGESGEEIISRWEALKLKEKEALEKAQEEIETLRNDIYELRALKIKDVISKYGTKFLSKNEQYTDENKLLVFFLRNGYIDETYVNYINYFHEDSITSDEQKFILGVRNYDGVQDFEQEIVHKQRVIDRLVVHEFRQIEVLNFSLVDYLLDSTKNKEKQEEILLLLSSRGSEVKEFIQRFLQKYDEKAAEFIAKLSNKNDFLWKDLMEDSSIPEETKIHYFDLILNSAGETSILRMNENGDRGIAEFIEKSENVFTKIKLTPTDKIVDILHSLDFMVEKIDCDAVDPKISELIFSESKYEICDNNFAEFVKLKKPEYSEEYKNAKHTVLLKMGDENVLENIDDNIDEYMEKVFYANGNNSESIEAILDICKKYDFDANAETVVDSQNAVYDDINVFLDECDEKDSLVQFIEHIFTTGKCVISWSNICAYYENYGLSEFLFGVIQQNIQKLASLPDELDDSLVIDLLMKEWNTEALRTFAQNYQMGDFDIDLNNVPKNNIRVLIEQNWLPFSIAVYNNISSAYPEMRLRYILNYQENFFEVVDEIGVDTIPVDELMKEARVDAERKIALIQRFPADGITRDMAIVIRNTELEIPKPYVLAAWALLELKEKYQLLLNHIEIFDNSELPKLFNELESMYKDLALRQTRHKVSLYCNDYNETLLKKLVKKRYVSSTGYEEKERTTFNPLPHKEKEKYVYAWVRAVNNS